jgi:hypothetical protein
MTLLRSLAPVVVVSLVSACTPTDRKYVDGGVEEAGLGEGDSSTPADGATTDAAEPDACGASCTRGCEPACTASAPVCNGGTCGACTDDRPCAAFAATPHCIDGACVACATHADCTDPANAACDPATHACVPCVPATSGPDEACAHFPSAPVCSAGACVECTADKDELCGTNVCDAQNSACDPTRAKRSKSVCNCPPGQTTCDAPAPCVSDDECQDGQACVDDKAGAGGYVCMTVKTADNFCARPFVKAETVTTVDGTSLSVCTYATAATCQAQADWRQRRCGTPRSDNAELDQPNSGDNAKCGAEGVDDGLCVLDSARGVYRCTVPCKNSVDDCPSDSSRCAFDATAARTVCSLD